MREYGVIPTRFWQSPTIVSLSPRAKLLAAYLITCPHSTMLGCFLAPVGYLAVDLRWSEERVVLCLSELSEKDFLTYDADTGWLVIHDFLIWDKVDNSNQAKNVMKLFDLIPQHATVILAIANRLLNYVKHLDEPFRNRLEALTQTVSKPIRTQEQEPSPDPRPGSNPDQELEMPYGISWSSCEKNPLKKNKKTTPLKLKTEKEMKFQEEAKAILAFLNHKAERAFREVDTNLAFITARLKSGATATQCRQVIVKKVREWETDAHMRRYLRPETLFNATKFEQYLGELVVPTFEETP